MRNNADRLAARDANRPDIVILAIPDEVLKVCHSVERSATAEERKTAAAIRKRRAGAQLDLFDAFEEVDQTEEDFLKRDLRSALKARALRAKLPIQMVTSNLLEDTARSQDAATRAWNFSVGVYYKAGGVPWRLPQTGPETCFVGISFHHLRTTRRHIVQSSLAQAFSSEGEGFAIRGEAVPATSDQGRNVHLSEKQAFDLATSIVKEYATRAGGPPVRVVIHKTTYFDAAELVGFRQALADRYCTLLVGMMVIFGALALPVTGWIERAPEISYQVRDQLSDMSAALSGVFDALDRLTSLTASDPDVERIAVESSPAIDIAALIPGILGQFVFTLILLFFLLASGDMFHEKLVHVMPTFHDKRQAVRVARDIERKLSRYLLTITIINAGLGLAVGSAMWLMGMPSPVVFGVIAFIFNYVPYLGAVAGVVIASAVALVSFDWVGWAPIVGSVYFACTTFEGQFVTPYFVGRNLRLNIVMVFLAVTFWAWLWSAIGMIVAVPLLAALRTIATHIDGMKGLADFLGERHSETTEDREGEP